MCRSSVSWPDRGIRMQPFEMLRPKADDWYHAWMPVCASRRPGATAARSSGTAPSTSASTPA
jgi:hypothetical protein